MKGSFLYKVAETFVDNIGELEGYCFVFPNRRSSLFFKKYLSELTPKPIFSPNITTISSLFTNLSGLRSADKISLLIDLHSVYSKYYPNTPFDEFVFWGDVILNDFDDVDKYLVGAKTLFKNVYDLNSISSDYSFLSERQREAIESFWGAVIKYSDGEKEERFLSIWEKLYPIYLDFKERLRGKGEGYEGMIQRGVADSMAAATELPAPLKNYTKIVFVGLNALNECEKVLLTTLRKLGVGDFYWDFYGKEITDPHNKSSLFMKENVISYPSHFTLSFEEFDTRLDERVVECVGVPSAVGQAKYLSTVLGSLSPDQTSVVLPDETLLFPVLNSIPQSVEFVNVTMGYSLKNSPLASFMALISQLWKKVRVEGERTLFYHANVISILDHQYIKGDSALYEVGGEIKKGIVEHNLIFVPVDTFQGCNCEILTHIFQERPQSLPKYQLTLLEMIQDRLSDIDKEFVLAYYKCINRLAGFNLQIKDETYFRLLDQLINNVSIPFTGEPLRGLQIMGPLETRCLDFENVIILSSNEGVFPSKSVSNSFIPHNLRVGFSLPTHEFQDSISAYHFYRSIYRAKRVIMVYDTRTEGVNKSGEVSRFIWQLKYHHQVPLVERVVSHKIFTTDQAPKSVTIDSKMVEEIANKITLSASSLNTYLDCPLKFYLQVIEKIREEEQVVEDVEANIFGTMFHEVMEGLYLPYRHFELSEGVIEKMIKDESRIVALIHSAFKKNLNIDKVEGKNRVIEALLIRYVKRTLNQDLRNLPFTFLDAEKKVFVEFNSKDLPFRCKFFGIIDRLDQKGDMVRVIDYKTGGYKIDFKEISELFDTTSAERPYTAFQMLFYLLLLEKSGSIAPTQIESVEMAICSLKDLFKLGDFKSFMVTQSGYEEFKRSLADLVSEIFNPDVPFVARGNKDSCKYCPYSMVCHK